MPAPTSSKILQASALLAALFACLGFAADFHPPAADHYAEVFAAGTVLPGGRLLKPYGVQIETGPGTFGLAVSPRGTVTTADIGYEMFGISIIEPPPANSAWRARHLWARIPDSAAVETGNSDWKGVTSGIAFGSGRSIWISEGDSGRIRQIDIGTGDPTKIVSLNGVEWKGSFTTDLVYDSVRHIVYVVDQANARVAVVDTGSGRVVSSVSIGVGLNQIPFAIALSPDGSTAYVTESQAVCVIDVRDPLQPVIADRIRTASPQAILATADRVFVSNTLDDSITIISAGERKVVAEIPLRIPSLEQFRGVMPAGLAYDPATKRLLVAEAGINAVGVVDTGKNQLIGHIPVGWMPARVAISGGRVYVANGRGQGTGPNPRREILGLGEMYVLHRGSVSTFPMPDNSEIMRQTAAVFALNGLAPYKPDAPKFPEGIRHVVLVVKQSRTFDEVLGDVMKAGDGTVLSLPNLARFGMHGIAHGGRGKFSLQDVPITPNQHEIARRWAFSDNFYADGRTRAEGDIWLNGGYPDLVTESRILASRTIGPTTRLWDHLQRSGVTFQNFGGSGKVSDQERATKFIAEIDRRYVKGGEPLPQFICIRLPNDGLANDSSTQAGYPFDVSFALDNDFATGRIVDYLSHSPWWRDTAIFITESDTQDSFDHVDAHRTLLFAAGPYVKRNYVSHTNSSFSGLLRTIFELLHVPPLNLMDAAAASLRDMFIAEPDFTTFTAVQPDLRVFDPEKVQSLR